MLNQLIRFSIQQRFFVMILAVLLLGVGIYNATLLPIDAVPDVTNKQVQINTLLPGLAPPEMEPVSTGLGEIYYLFLQGAFVVKSQAMKGDLAEE